MIEYLSQNIIINGVLLLAVAILISRLFSMLRLPKVTGYLLTGVLIASSSRLYGGLSHSFISPELYALLDNISQLSIGIIIFNIGEHFNLENIKKSKHSIFQISFCEVGITFCTVFLLTAGAFMIVEYSTGRQLIEGSAVMYASLLGVLATSTAPAATSVVLREYDSQGPLTEHIFILLGLNSILCIVLTHYATSIIGQKAVRIFYPSLSVLVPCILGMFSGLLFCFVEKFFKVKNECAIVILVFLTLHGILCSWLNTVFVVVNIPVKISPLLIHLFFSIAVVNISTRGHYIFQAMKLLDLPFYILFFVFAGMKLNVYKLADVQVLVFVYVCARVVGKLMGAYVGLWRVKMFRAFGFNLGLSFLSQGGLAITLITLIQDNVVVPENFVMTALSGIMAFEIIGPISVQRSLLRAGEIKQLFVPSKRYYKSVQNTYYTIRLKLKTLFFSYPNNPILCKDIMQTRVDTLFDTAHFHELFTFFSTHNYENCVIIDHGHHLVGIVSYKEMRKIIITNTPHEELRAKDIVDKSAVAYPHDSIQSLCNTFNSLPSYLACIPVVTADTPTLFIGIVTRKDVIGASGSS